jgi:hypothetical protein
LSHNEQRNSSHPHTSSTCQCQCRPSILQGHFSRLYLSPPFFVLYKYHSSLSFVCASSIITLLQPFCKTICAGSHRKDQNTGNTELARRLAECGHSQNLIRVFVVSHSVTLSPHHPVVPPHCRVLFLINAPCWLVAMLGLSLQPQTSCANTSTNVSLILFSTASMRRDIWSVSFPRYPDPSPSLLTRIFGSRHDSCSTVLSLSCAYGTHQAPWPMAHMQRSTASRGH